MQPGPDRNAPMHRRACSNLIRTWRASGSLGACNSCCLLAGVGAGDDAGAMCTAVARLVRSCALWSAGHGLGRVAEWRFSVSLYLRSRTFQQRYPRVSSATACTAGARRRRALLHRQCRTYRLLDACGADRRLRSAMREGRTSAGAAADWSCDRTHAPPSARCRRLLRSAEEATGPTAGIPSTRRFRSCARPSLASSSTSKDPRGNA